jgi:hypothetical protein
MLNKVSIDGYGEDGLSTAGLEKLSREGFSILVPGQTPGERSEVARYQWFRVAVGEAQNAEEALARIKRALGPEADHFYIHVGGPVCATTEVLQSAG